MRPEERSDLWGVCHELAVAVYRATREWPAVEMYGLAARAREAAVAAALHAADDPPISDPAVRRRRLYRALHALQRLGYFLMLACELEYLMPDAWRNVDCLRHRAEDLVRALLAAPGDSTRGSVRERPQPRPTQAVRPRI